MATSEETRSPRAVGTTDATAVLVNYNSGHRLGPLLDLIEPEVRAIAIVDNASSDGSLAPAEKRPAVTIIRNDSNRGFAAAANQGAAVAETTWILFLNPDAHLRPGDIARLLGAVPDDVAAVAPLQVDEAGDPISETGGYDPSLARYAVWAVLPVRYHRRMGPWMAPPFPTGDTDVDWASGAMLGIRGDVFRTLGGFDEKFFLYHEDIDFGRRARRAGYRVLVRPSVRLHHEVGHGDQRRRIAAGIRALESMALDFPPGWRRRTLGAILGVGYGLRAIGGSHLRRERARAVLPYCRALMAGRLPGEAAEG